MRWGWRGDYIFFLWLDNYWAIDKQGPAHSLYGYYTLGTLIAGFVAGLVGKTALDRRQQPASYPRRQPVPCGESSRMTPTDFSSSRIRSASTKFFAFFAA